MCLDPLLIYTLTLLPSQWCWLVGQVKIGAALTDAKQSSNAFDLFLVLYNCYGNQGDGIGG